ncbi:MAG TPA: glycosyltransferase [Microvirga sp.]
MLGVRVLASARARWSAARRRRLRSTLERSDLFDGAWYLRRNPDVAAAGADPLDHYLYIGGFEGRDPSPGFDSDWYLAAYPDVAAKGLNPLLHYLRRGLAEGRSPAEVDERRIRALVARTLASETYRRILADAPRVSVVLATRNRRDEVVNAIESVRVQSYPHWELLVVDDGSTDGTVEALEARFDDPRIRIIRAEPSGVSKARNRGLAAATGAYIAYIDSDNVWTPDFLAVSLATIVESGADFTYAGIKCIVDPDVSYFRFVEFDFERLIKRNFIDLNVILHHRSLYEAEGGFDEALRRMVDWDLIIRYTKGRKIAFIPFIGALYDDSERSDRITRVEGLFWKYVILSKHVMPWAAVDAALAGRDPSLVSVVIPVYGQGDLTEECLRSLFAEPAGAPFEVVLVDNGSDEETAGRLDAWAQHPGVRLVRHPDNLNFALGCNTGFAASRGGTVVFLNNDTIVTANWLAPLVEALRRPGIGAVQPKLVYPDRTIQCIGVAFSRHSAIGYPIYAHEPEDAPHVSRSAPRQAVTAACVAVRAGDFAALRGFDPRFMNGQEDLDFCLRLKGERGLGCWYEAESRVIHQESKTPGRGLHIRDNRRLFRDLWSERIVADDTAVYEADGFSVVRWDIDNKALRDEGLESFRPRLVPRGKARTRAPGEALRLAIKIGCPSAEQKEEWGDYHFAASLAAAFERLGCRCRIDFLNDWEIVEGDDDVNLVLRGLSAFAPPEAHVNVMWMISHPDRVGTAELARYDHVFVASQSHAGDLSAVMGDRVSALLQCTDPDLFHPRPGTPRRYEALFVGNSRNVFRPVVKDALAAGIDVTIVGTRWQGFIPPERISGENIPNAELGAHYGAAAVVLNDHWPDMREKGFVSNRIFDVMACGVPLVSDPIAGLPPEIERCLLTFTDAASLKAAVETARGEDDARRAEREALAALIRARHSFDDRARTMLATIERLLQERGGETARVRAAS